MTGLELKVRRISARIKAIELARIMGVSASRVSSIEREAVVSAAAASKYLAALETCRTSGASEVAS
jgi:transcriptional regulator with XRE-family HTH domain